MPAPITITILADDDEQQADHLIVNTDRNLVLLSLEDQDEIQWICTRGTATIDFAPANNPFDPNTSTGGQYLANEGGSVTSGPPASIVLEGEENSIFRQFKYNIIVTDGTRSGSLDPHVRVRRSSVYKAL